MSTEAGVGSAPAEGTESEINRPAALAGFLLFAVIGATSATFGPTIPAFRSTFHITAAGAGLLLSGHFTGSLAGTLLPGFVPHRFRGPRPIAAASAVCFALGCVIISLAPAWPAAIGGAIIEGTGWGGLVIAFNALFSSGFGARSSSMLLLLNAAFGVGAILGPAGVGLLAGGGFRGPFLTAAGAALLLVPLTFALPRDEVIPPLEDGAEDRSVSGLFGPLAIFMAAFFLYSGLEGGIGSWETTHLVATGLAATTAATVTSLFWTGLTIGRLLTAPLTLLVRPERLVMACLGAAFVLVLAARIDVLTAAAYTISGLALAPIFPLSLVWSRTVMPASQRITSFVITGDLLGGVFISALLGQLVTHVGVESLPIAFALMAAGTFGLFLTILLRARRA